MLKRLAPFLREKVSSSEWPGTRLLNQRASVFCYNFGVECAQVLKEATNSLYAWQQPDLPEDLCLLFTDGDPWLVTISHERDSYLSLTEEEKAHLLNVAPDFGDLLEMYNPQEETNK